MIILLINKRIKMVLYKIKKQTNANLFKHKEIGDTT